MWICPNCGREFKKKNQGHYCGKSYETVEEYIQAQSIEKQFLLNEIRNIIIRNISDANECILWNMPTYKKEHSSVSFATCKEHVSLYVGEEVIIKFKHELKDMPTKNSAIYLSYNSVLPSILIGDIIKEIFN